MRGAFRGLLIPQVNKFTPDWHLEALFAAQEIDLQYRVSDEFDIIEAPDILAISSKTSKAPLDQSNAASN